MADWDSQDWTMGGAQRLFVATARLSPFLGKVIRFAGPDAARTVLLPDARHWPVDNCLASIFNEQTTNSVAIQDATGTLLATLAPGRMAEAFLVENGTKAGVWLLDEFAAIYP